LVDSKIDKIHVVRGELPLEVQDLEDEIAGLKTRLENYKEEIEERENMIAEKQNAMKDSKALITKYEEQRNNVRNNREYDSLTKEIEYQGLEIQLAEKRIKENKEFIASKEEEITAANTRLEERIQDLEAKKQELEEIVGETEKEEQALMDLSKESETMIEDRLLSGYKRIRKNARNGLAVVPVERDACGGCFNKIPPQRQLDIRMHKKIIVCEYCGRILVDETIIADAERTIEA
jgi:predicted  nucleic acid-binding Zn-ribbon protein